MSEWNVIHERERQTETETDRQTDRQRTATRYSQLMESFHIKPWSATVQTPLFWWMWYTADAWNLNLIKIRWHWGHDPCIELIASRKTGHWDWAECRGNQVLLTVSVTKPAADDAGEGDDYPTSGPPCAGTATWRDEGHGSLNDGLDTLSVFLNFALTEVWVQRGVCREGRFRDLRSVQMGPVKIHLTVKFSVCPGCTESVEPHSARHGKHENYSRPVMVEAVTIDSAVWVKSKVNSSEREAQVS